MAVASTSLVITLIAVLGGLGIIPLGQGSGSRASAASSDRSTSATAPSDVDGTVPSGDASDGAAGKEAADDKGATTGTGAKASEAGEQEASPSPQPSPPSAAPPVPADSGAGRRAVFSESEQQVWLVDDDGSVLRSYPVSGSTFDNLDPGTYQVYSRSEDAVGVDGSTMHWFVRFTRGSSGAAIGFHSIPEKDGAPVQTLAQLGTPLSHGCIRQREPDALAMWDFAQLGDTVVVTA
ncbi:MAG: L,D-transpeptidase [Nocardioides sp.]|uniref:L,D-transpeptidase n=1 Tax=Nocardioides sp. TaxID=35761 RepID=UPI0039E3B55B